MAQLFPQLSAGPPGFLLAEEVLAVEDEERLLAWARALRLEPYVLHGTASLRRVLAFGAVDEVSRRSLEVAAAGPLFAQPVERDAETGTSPAEHAALPPEVRWLAQRCAPLGDLDPASIVMALVSRYPRGAGIGWHLDRPSYGPVVIGVSLGGPCRLRLRPRGGGAAVTVPLPPRSAYVLSGAARSGWEHSIPAVSAERWSVTLRTLARR